MAAIAGSAVGLGNIWKFPYVAGQNGGAAFLIIYIVISLLISVPVMLSEFVIGRRGQGNTYHHDDYNHQQNNFKGSESFLHDNHLKKIY